MSGSITIGWFGPTNDYWEWILGHFRDVSLLTARNVEDWVLLQSNALRSNKLARPALLVAIESRFDPAVDFIRGYEQAVAPKDNKTQTLPWCVLLGDDWVGHRRTYPLAESLQTFYWYELHDRLLPWLIDASPAASTESSADSANAVGKRRTSPRVQRLIDVSLSLDGKRNDCKSASNPIELALVVTETAAMRQLWCEAFARYKIQCVATTPTFVDLWAKPDVIVIDIESEPLVVRQRQLDCGRTGCLVRKLAEQFPDSIIVVADPFPRWENWKILRESGADILVGKPFQLAGIRSSLMTLASNESRFV